MSVCWINVPFKAQIDDIIKLSVEQVYESREVVEKEIAGFEILTTLLDARTRSIDNDTLHYNKLITKLFDSPLRQEVDSLYHKIMSICGEIAMLTDSKALRFYKKIRGMGIE